MSGQDFWSRRKAGVEAETAREKAEETARQDSARQEDLAEKPESEVLEELGLPDPDTLEQGDDFSVFLRGAVPEALRRRALRRLWRSNPVLANLDGLNDYDEDFTGAGSPQVALKTAYQVGKGIYRELVETPEAESEVEVPVPPQADREIWVSETPCDPDEGAAMHTSETDAIPVNEDAPRPEPAPSAPARRRMRFTFLD